MNSPLAAPATETATNKRLLDLVQTRYGLFNRSVGLTPSPGDPLFSVTVARLGDLGSVLPGLANAPQESSARNSLDGAGSGLEPEDSNVRAVAEGLERYASS